MPDQRTKFSELGFQARMLMEIQLVTGVRKGKMNIMDTADIV